MGLFLLLSTVEMSAIFTIFAIIANLIFNITQLYYILDLSLLFESLAVVRVIK